MKKILTLMTTAAIACGMLMGCGTDSGFADYENETVWGRVTSVSDTGFNMDVGILDDSNAFAVNDEKAQVTISDDTDLMMSAFIDATDPDARDMTDATIDDIKVGDLVAVKYDNDGDVDSVIVKMMAEE